MPRPAGRGWPTTTWRSKWSTAGAVVRRAREDGQDTSRDRVRGLAADAKTLTGGAPRQPCLAPPGGGGGSGRSSLWQ